MNEVTNFHNEILNNNQAIVEYYTTNPKDVIKLCDLDINLLSDLAIEFNNALNNEELTPFNKTQIRKALVATVLAIKRIEKNNDINQSKG